MKTKIKDFDLKNCSFHDYKMEVFIIGEDNQLASYDLIKYFIEIRDKNAPGTELIYQDLWKGVSKEILTDLKILINSDLINYKNISKASVINVQNNITSFVSSLASFMTSPPNNPKYYADFYSKYKETILFEVMERFFNDGEDVFLNHLINQDNKLISEYYLDFIYIHANNKNYQIHDFVKFIDNYFKADENMHVLNLSRKEYCATDILGTINSDILNEHLKGKKININAELSSIFKNRYKEESIFNIMSLILKYNESLSKEEKEYLANYMTKYEVDSINKNIKDEVNEKSSKKRL